MGKFRGAGSQSKIVKHLFGGGWATDLSPNAELQTSGADQAVYPFLTEAENLIFGLDGSVRKVHGTTRLNSTAIGSGGVIKGLYDCWFSGTGGTPTQHRVVHVGTVCMEDDGDGSFVNLFTGLTSGAAPSYAMLEDLLVVSSDSDVPKSWNGTTAQNLAGSPPNFAFCVEHKNRLWAAGVDANPSRLYYCAQLSPADWAGAGSGFIDISPSDGDVITGLISHLDELWVFKGVNKGSIHRIAGSAPTGEDSFARKTFVIGIGAIGHNTIFRLKDDIGFIWNGTVLSLKTTAAFGDFEEVALSRPIKTWLQDHLNFARLKHAWACNWSDEGLVLFALPIDSSTNNNVMLAMDVRFEPVRWAKWSAFACGALAQVIDPGDRSRPVVMSGGNDGFVRKHGQNARSVDGITSIAFNLATPFVDYGSSWIMKTLSGASMKLNPRNTASVTFGYTRDQNIESTESFTVSAGGDVLGPSSTNPFTLNVSSLAGSSAVDQFVDFDGSEFRAVSYAVRNNTLNADLELLSFNTRFEIDAESTGQ